MNINDISRNVIRNHKHKSTSFMLNNGYANGGRGNAHNGRLSQKTMSTGNAFKFMPNNLNQYNNLSPRAGAAVLSNEDFENSRNLDHLRKKPGKNSAITKMQ